MLLDLTVRFFRRIATPSFFTFALLLTIVGSVVYGLSEIIRGLEFGPLFSLSFLALLLGWLLARSQIKTWIAALILITLGMLGIYIWVGNLLPLLLNLLRSLPPLAWAYLLQQDSASLITSFQLANAEFALAVTIIWVDVQDWVGGQLAGNPTYRITAVFLFWGLAIWIVSAWAGWVQRRYANAVLSITPASLLLVAALGYTWEDISYLLPLSLAVFFLVALTFMQKNEKRWQTTGIDYPTDARTDTLVTAIAISLGLVMAAFFLPRLSIRKVVETIQELTSPQVQQAQPFMEALGIEVQRPSIGRFGSMLSGGLPRDHLIGSGPDLSEQVVVSVQITGGLPPGSEADDAIPLYWRGLTYDQYTGSGWDSTGVSLRRYAPVETVGLFERPHHWIIEQEMRFIDETELLFAAGELITADEGFSIAWRTEPISSEIERHPGDFFGASIDEINYRAQSFIPVADEVSLRASSYAYPNWVRETYLSVETTTRVRNLARDLTQRIHSPYDRARSIERYLRRFEYTTDLPAPPENKDVVDYFLFDLQKGYCDYFASSMVVLARAAGLPARLVVGYTRGTYDAVNDRYIIAEANAHSWPEIYFQGIGWVPFEPTSGINEITRSPEPLAFPGDVAYVIETDSLLGGIEPFFGSWLLTIGAASLVLIWLGMIGITLDEWLLKRHSPEEMAIRIYGRLYRHGRRLGSPARRDDTPFEFAATLREQVTSLPIKSIAKKPMQQADQAISDLTGIYVRSQYSPQNLNDDEKARTMAIWQRLRRQLMLARGLYWLRKLESQKSTEETKTLE
jgi:transglutaminase-like putative cysteine protease